jgi:hypothetical protein
MKDESSLEFDILEEVRCRLISLFEGRGHGQIEAERAALYVVQGLRGGHKLIAAVTREGKSDDALLAILEDLFENAPALDRARAILSGQDDEKVVH